MKVGDLVKFKNPRGVKTSLAMSPQDDVGLIVKLEQQQLWGIKDCFQEIANVRMTTTQSDYWMNTQELEALNESKCQENVKSVSNALQSDSERVTL